MQPLRRPVPSLLNEELTHATMVRLDSLLQCGCCRVWRQSDSPHVGPSPTSSPTVSSVTVRAPSNRTIFIGNRVQFTAQSTLRDGTTQNVTTSGTWGSGNPSVARVNQNGMVTAVAAGNANIFVDVNPRGSFRIRVFPQVSSQGSVQLWPVPWLISQTLSSTYVAGEHCLYLERNCRLSENPAHGTRRKSRGACQFQGAEQSARVRPSGKTSAKVQAAFHECSWFVAL